MPAGTPVTTSVLAEVWDEQEKLAQLIEDGRQLATDLYWANRADTTAYTHHPDYVAMEKLIAAQRQIVSRSQGDLGGVVYRVANENLDSLVKKFNSLNRKADKAGVPRMMYRVSDEQQFDSGYLYTFVVVAAGKVQIEGWEFLAKLTVEPGGVLVSRVPAMARLPWDASEEQIKEEEERLNAINLAAFADPKTASECDHCEKFRQRKQTYVVRHVETGEFKQVGSTCLREFIGVDPQNIARYAQWIHEINEQLKEGGRGTERHNLVEEFVTHACCVIRAFGYVKASESNSTKDTTLANIYNYGKVGKFGPLYVALIDADAERAKAAIQWALDTFGAKDEWQLSDFDRNILVAVRGIVTTPRTEGILAYLPVAHSRAIERELEKKAEAEARVDEFYGIPGARLELELTVDSIFEHEGGYGCTYITKLHDAEGHAFTWFGSYPLERGGSYVGKWTIKKHEEHEKFGKQTIINRPAGLAPVKEEA